MKTKDNSKIIYTLKEIDSCSISNDIEQIKALDLTRKEDKILLVYEDHISIYLESN